MFQLSDEEFTALRSHFATSNETAARRGGRRYLPYAFIEHGAIMAATILNSPRATEMSVYVVRELMVPPTPEKKRPIGFVTTDKK